MSSEGSEIIEDMWVLNCRGNQNVSRLQVLWDATPRVIELGTGAGTHIQRHAASDKEATLNVFYVQVVTYMSQLIEKTNMLIVDTDKK